MKMMLAVSQTRLLRWLPRTDLPMMAGLTSRFCVAVMVMMQSTKLLCASFICGSGGRSHHRAAQLSSLDVICNDGTKNDNDTSNSRITMKTFRMTTASGKALCRYALGGAARSVQSSSLPLRYRQMLSSDNELGSPFYFYYNPHRYPPFLSGIASQLAEDGPSRLDRKDVFIASGGSERSIPDINQRVQDTLKYSGGAYLDAFVLEYVCPQELEHHNALESTSTLHNKITQTTLGVDLEAAIIHLRSLAEEGKIRYILASTHSHFVGAVLSNSKVDSLPSLDSIMLRYNLSHKKAAESLSFSYALKNAVPVIAFTSTRWNRLLEQDPLIWKQH